jgi:peptide/nickel transport system substrate-binding protein
VRRWIALLGLLLLVAPAWADDSTLRVVMNIELQVLDPQVTTATVTRAFGYMVYDTLIAMDQQGKFHPQMLEKWAVSDDRLTWTFTLRPGLAWHDGSPVTSDDCVASLRRWAVYDGFGKRLMAATDSLTVVDARTFALHLSRPFAFVIEALGKPNAYVPFILPARLVANATAKRITEVMGSGPFIFRKEERRPGDRAVFHRNPAYQHRAEPADGLAGGKVCISIGSNWSACPIRQRGSRRCRQGRWITWKSCRSTTSR